MKEILIQDLKSINDKIYLRFLKRADKLNLIDYSKKQVDRSYNGTSLAHYYSVIQQL